MERHEINERFARYRDLLGEEEWLALGDALERPLPSTFWTHLARTDHQEVAESFRRDGHQLISLAYASGGYLSTRPMRWGRRIEFRSGLIHLQEAASMLPPLALKPKAGELVLDLCAAPGGKSAQLSLMMENLGTLVVNDLSFSRLRALRATQERLGLKNMVLCAQEGQQLLKDHPPVFDKVLVDAPCSCEGTLRKKGRWSYEPDEGDFKKRLIETQRALLTQALKLTKPGGRVVYSTCSLDPAENEEVIDAVLSMWAKRGHHGSGPTKLDVEPLDLPHLIASPGLTSWQGRKMSASLRHGLRVYPHQNDSGGFFLASIRVSGRLTQEMEQARQGWSTPQLADPTPLSDVYRWAENAHGLSSEAWQDVCFTQGNRRYLSAVSADLILPPTRYQVAGLPSFYTRGAVPRLTSAAALEWGSKATRGICELWDRNAVDRYYAKDEQALPCGVIYHRGVCIVRFQGVPLGLGYVHIKENGDAVLKSEYPERLRLAEGCSVFERPEAGERRPGPERPPTQR